MKGKVILVIMDGVGFDTAVSRCGFLEGMVELGRARRWRMRAALPTISAPLYETLHTGAGSSMGSSRTRRCDSRPGRTCSGPSMTPAAAPLPSRSRGFSRSTTGGPRCACRRRGRRREPADPARPVLLHGGIRPDQSLRARGNRPLRPVDAAAAAPDLTTRCCTPVPPTLWATPTREAGRIPGTDVADRQCSIANPAAVARPGI